MKIRLAFNRFGSWYEETPLGMEFEGWTSEERPGVVFISTEFFILYTDCEVIVEEKRRRTKEPESFN